MISENTLKEISHIFCGDTGDFYSYKTGPALVAFFNRYFRARDVYAQGFPSRWSYVYDKLVPMLNNNTMGAFFDIILSKEYLISDLGITEIEASEKSKSALNEFNRIVARDQYKLTFTQGHYRLIRENDDLELIGSGGFANVYRQKSTGLILKKLKDDFQTDPSIRSRFKREFSITKSLQGMFGIIQVYSYNEDNCSYTMERAETTLEDYFLNNTLSDEIKINCIRQVLHILAEVHKMDIIHRDISPNNIFIISGMLEIADFGLGKDLKVFSSHQTLHTNALGQYFYCAPEQFMMLKDADKRSDVYSLGRIINFIMTGDPRNPHHIFRNVAEKATNSNAAYRYGDATQLSEFFEKAIEYQTRAENKEKILMKIRSGKYDDAVENFIYDMNAESISKALLDHLQGFQKALLTFMSSSESHAQHIIQSIEQSFRDVCGRSFVAYDPFAAFAHAVLAGNYSFVVKEIAATILRFVAWDVNRFSAQHLVDDLISSGIDPMLEDIIRT